MIDSYLAANHFKGNAYDERAIEDTNSFYLAFRALGGPFHPTAEGHAAVADSIYCRAVSLLFKDQTKIQCDKGF